MDKIFMVSPEYLSFFEGFRNEQALIDYIEKNSSRNPVYTEPRKVIRISDDTVVFYEHDKEPFYYYRPGVSSPMKEYPMIPVGIYGNKNEVNRWVNFMGKTWVLYSFEGEKK